MKEIFTAKSVEDAKKLAVEKFGVDEERITFSVLEEPKKSLFGKVKGEAKVEAEFELKKIDVAVKYIKDVLSALGIQNPDCTFTEVENGAEIEVSGDEIESFIGKKGEALDSLQYLASLACNKVDREYYRITLDSKGFREKRKEQLEELARKMATNVKKNGRTAALEPMNPYERRIIHAAVSEIEGVTSRSVGEEPYRKVLISSTEKKPIRENKGQRRQRKPQKAFDITTSFEKEYKKPKPEDTMTGAGLYSKIEF